MQEVATATLRCLRRHVPAAVPGIVFLSGGQEERLATSHLDAINRLPVAKPWTISFSYGRALQDPALKAWHGSDENLKAGAQAIARRARCNSAASLGAYTEEMEQRRRITARRLSHAVNNRNDRERHRFETDRQLDVRLQRYLRLREAVMPNVLSNAERSLIDAYWRAANYLSVGQIYLYDNPLLKEPLTKEHIKPRLLGHWGTTPGLNFIYVHLNRLIKKHDLDMIYITGPGHGGPAWSRTPISRGPTARSTRTSPQDEEGMKRLFTQFSFPGGIPSHVAPETPGSIHEGGELGYALSHAYGAAFDNPDLIVACVVGDGEAETGPLATSWHSNKFLNPVTDGAVLPILHLNGYKIANPTRPGPDQPRGAGPAVPRLRLHAVFRRGGRPRRRCTS